MGLVGWRRGMREVSWFALGISSDRDNVFWTRAPTAYKEIDQLFWGKVKSKRLVH